MTPFLFQQVQDQLKNRASQREVISKALRATGVQLASVSPNVIYQSYLYGTNAAGGSRFGSGTYAAYSPSVAPSWPAGRKVNVALRACLGGFTAASADWNQVTAAATGELDDTAVNSNLNTCNSRDESDHSLLWYHLSLFDPNDGHLIAGPNPNDVDAMPKDRDKARYNLKGERCQYAIGTAEYNSECVLEVQTLFHPVCSGDELLLSPPPPVAYRSGKQWIVEGLPGPKLQAAVAATLIKAASRMQSEARAATMSCLVAVKMDFFGNKTCDPTVTPGYFRCPATCADTLPGSEDWCCAGIPEDTYTVGNTSTATATSTSTSTGGVCHVSNFLTACADQYQLAGQYVQNVQCVGGVGIRCTSSDGTIYDVPGSVCATNEGFCTGTGTATSTGTSTGTSVAVTQVDSCSAATSIIVRYVVGPAPGVSVDKLALVRTLDSAYQPDGTPHNVLDQPQTKVCGQVFKATGVSSGVNNVLGTCL